MYKEAVNNLVYRLIWRAAIKEEILLLALNRTWEKYISLKGINLILTKQVFIVKIKLNSTIKRFKARLIV